MSLILLATTGGPYCRPAEDYALDYCARNNTSLGIIHVVESTLSHYGLVDSLATEGDRSDFIEHAKRQELPEARRRLSRIVKRARSMNINSKLYIEWKSPLYCILHRIRQSCPKMLVVGGKGRKGNPFGLVRCLSRKAPCLVMQVSQPTTEQQE